MNLSGTNLENARQHNRRVVMEAIRLHGRLSRADITRLTGLTPQTISNITAELHDLGFLSALAPEPAGRGQPAVPFVLNPRGAYSIGLELNQHALHAVVVNLAGDILASASCQVNRPTPTEALEPIQSAIARLRSTADMDWKRVLGVGVAIPGPFGVEGMSAIGPTTLPGWKDLSVGGRLSEAVGLPVAVANDGTAAAIGERLYGNGLALRSFAYIYIGEGLGAGLFLNGQIYDGIDRNAGEIGHMVVERSGRPCYCGNQGCLERYVSLLAAYESCGLPDPAQATPADLLQLLQDGNPQLLRWLDDAAACLRQAINILECMLDVQTIIVGGLLPRPVLQALMERLHPLLTSVSSRADRSIARLQLGMAGTDIAALGAAALPIFNELSPSREALLKNP